MRLFCSLLFLLILITRQLLAGAAANAEVPFQFRDGFIWINVSVGGAERPLHFLLDSGAQVSVIDSATSQHLGLKRGRPVAVAGVGTTTRGYWPQTLNAQAGVVSLPANYLMLDLGRLSEACTNGAVDGIIGADFFRDRIVQVDFRGEVVRLLGTPPPETGAQVLPLKVRRCGLLVPVQVNNAAAQWVRLDTGCASALRWVAARVNPERCRSRMAVALAPVSVAVTETRLTVGSIRFELVPTDVQPGEIFPGERGLLGNGILSRFGTVNHRRSRKKSLAGAYAAGRREVRLARSCWRAR